MRRSFSVLSWLLSLAGACLCAWVAAASWDNVNGTGEYILWSGAFFAAIFIGGFAGLQLSLALNRRWRPVRPRRWIPAFAASAILIFGTGAGGQALVMLSSQEVQTTSASVDMVLLLDASSSMDDAGVSQPRTEAATQFVDALPPDHALQAISFASAVLDSTRLLPLDDAGKQSLKAFISAIDSIGMTDFNEPLIAAIQTLSAQTQPERGRAVLLLTDGEGSLDGEVVNDLISQDIQVFSVRISNSESLSPEAQALVDLAEATGGFDTCLRPDGSGSVDTADLLAAFQAAFQASTEDQLVMEEELLIASSHASLYQLLIRLVTLIAIGVLFGIGYYAQIHLRTLLYNALSGAMLTAAVSILGSSAVLCMVLCCLLLAAAYVALEQNGGDTLDV